MNDYECTNPQRRRIEAHQEANAEVWEEEKWREVRDQFISKHPICRYCGDPADVPHHPDLSVYGKEEYFDLTDSIPTCHICHKGIHKNKFACPKCKKIRGTRQDGTCYSCLDADTKQDIRAGKLRRTEVKNRAGRQQYIKAHPTKKVVDPKTGKWVSVKR